MIAHARVCVGIFYEGTGEGIVFVRKPKWGRVCAPRMYTSRGKQRPELRPLPFSPDTRRARAHTHALHERACVSSYRSGLAHVSFCKHTHIRTHTHAHTHVVCTTHIRVYLMLSGNCARTPRTSLIFGKMYIRALRTGTETYGDGRDWGRADRQSTHVL